MFPKSEDTPRRARGLERGAPSREGPRTSCWTCSGDLHRDVQLTAGTESQPQVQEEVAGEWVSFGEFGYQSRGERALTAGVSMQEQLDMLPTQGELRERRNPGASLPPGTGAKAKPGNVSSSFKESQGR